jgi:predicted phosphodiesterase
MKIQILSDVHNELLSHDESLLPLNQSDYSHWHGSVPETEADVVVLAGDINTGTRGIEWALKESERLRKPFIYVAGNHEFYHREYHSTLKQMRELTQETNVHFLECDEVILSGVRFLGTSLWTDYNAVENISQYEAMKACQDALNDHQVIRMSPDGLFTTRHAFELHAKSLKWLQNKLSSVNEHSKTVVVTHHGPSTACQHKKYLVNAISAGFYSNLDELVGKADVWVSGHSHSNLDTTINGCRLLSNQSGYPGENVDGFASNMTIKI